jgi:hypothetical protein
MAITNAQQYKQLLANGGRIGLKGGADAATASFGKSVGYSDSKTGSTGKADPKGGFDLGGGKGPTFDGAPATTVDSDTVKKEKKKYQDQFTSKGIAPPGPNRKARQRALNYTNKQLARYLSRFGSYYDPNKFSVTKTGYPNFGFPNIYEAIGEELEAGKELKDILKTGNMIPIGKSGTSFEMSAVPDLDIDSIRELAATQTLAQGAPLTGYQAGALKDLKTSIGKRDVLLDTGDTSDIYPDPPEATNTGPDDPVDPCLGPNPPAYCFVNNDPTEEDPRQILSTRILGSQFDPTFFANEGGRVAAQQGGIMPRLNDLSGNVSSAEQMLQEINQRLQSAESTLGEGGGQLTSISGGGFGSGGPLDQGIGQVPLQEAKVSSAYDQRGPFNVQDAYAAAQKSAQETRAGGMLGQVVLPGEMSFEDFSNNFSNFNFGQPMQLPASGGLGGAMGSPLQTALGLADGGRAALAEGGMPYEGGIMDLESGRQMYFLGKLVKKATRAVKKIAKSPIGKAALMYFGGNALMGKMGGLGGLKGSLFGTAGGTARMTPGILGKLGLTGGGGSMGLTGLGKAALIGIPSIIPFLAGKEEENDFDIDAYYAANQLIPGTTKRQMGSEFDFYKYNLAEGGMPSKEPVAKKTMPLIDMDGQEMDLRADGGFVPIGRMERADDVPARLSKNEFVFTADAVRNAGEGDIDKGAEVMYNMMKNLESGGEVSEESQGLDGAREMFQTSKRLEEVL